MLFLDDDALLEPRARRISSPASRSAPKATTCRASPIGTRWKRRVRRWRSTRSRRIAIAWAGASARCGRAWLSHRPRSGSQAAMPRALRRARGCCSRRAAPQAIRGRRCFRITFWRCPSGRASASTGVVRIDCGSRPAGRSPSPRWRVWYVDLPWALPHRREPAKQWLGPSDNFPQEPVHFLLDYLSERATAIAGDEPEAAPCNDRRARRRSVARRRSAPARPARRARGRHEHARAVRPRQSPRRCANARGVDSRADCAGGVGARAGASLRPSVVRLADTVAARAAGRGSVPIAVKPRDENSLLCAHGCGCRSGRRLRWLGLNDRLRATGAVIGTEMTAG